MSFLVTLWPGEMHRLIAPDIRILNFMFIDVHSHILPDVDDGAGSLDESRAMLAHYVGLGFDTIVATPHTLLDESVLSGGPVCSPQEPTVDHHLFDLAEIAADQHIALLKGSEVRLTPDAQGARDVLPRLTLGDSRAILVDFPSETWPFYAEDSLFQLQLLGFTPVLAHPERYWTQPDDIDIAKGLVNRGVLLQVTLASLVGTFGKLVKTMAITLLESELVHVVATDAHGIGPRLDAVGDAIEWIEESYGSGVLAGLLAENPAALLAGEGIDPVMCRDQGRRLFSFSGLRFWR